MVNYVDEVKKLLGDKITLYQVGGSVRDELLGRTPSDYDFTTPQKPDEIEQAIRDAHRKPYLVGKRFGTIGIRINGKVIEITTFRTEEYLEKNRKPEVQFVDDLRLDLARRDFTINAIAKDMDGNIIDPFGGGFDILSKVIRCVGKPKDRFREDPLRILRAARFSSQLSMSINEFTEGYMKKMSSNILNVSKERWTAELDKLLMTKEPFSGLDYLMKNRLFNFMIPELSVQKDYDQNSPYHDFDLWTHTLKVVCKVSQNIDLRWAALLHDIAKPFVATNNKKGFTNYIDHEKLGYEMVIKIGKHLRWSNDRIESVSGLVLNHLKDNSPLKEADDSSKRG